METNSKTTNMETTKELIAHVNDLVNAAKPIADQSNFLMLFPKRLEELELEQFVELCDWRECEPKKYAQRFEADMKIDGIVVNAKTCMIPELMQRQEPSVLDLIKSILADRKAQASAA